MQGNSPMGNMRWFAVCLGCLSFLSWGALVDATSGSGTPPAHERPTTGTVQDEHHPAAMPIPVKNETKTSPIGTANNTNLTPASTANNTNLTLATTANNTNLTSATTANNTNLTSATTANNTNLTSATTANNTNLTSATTANNTNLTSATTANNTNLTSATSAISTRPTLAMTTKSTKPTSPSASVTIANSNITNSVNTANSSERSSAPAANGNTPMPDPATKDISGIVTISNNQRTTFSSVPTSYTMPSEESTEIWIFAVAGSVAAVVLSGAMVVVVWRCKRRIPKTSESKFAHNSVQTMTSIDPVIYEDQPYDGKNQSGLSNDVYSMTYSMDYNTPSNVVPADKNAMALKSANGLRLAVANLAGSSLEREQSAALGDGMTAPPQYLCPISQADSRQQDQEPSYFEVEKRDAYRRSSSVDSAAMDITLPAVLSRRCSDGGDPGPKYAIPIKEATSLSSFEQMQRIDSGVPVFHNLVSSNPTLSVQDSSDQEGLYNSMYSLPPRQCAGDSLNASVMDGLLTPNDRQTSLDSGAPSTNLTDVMMISISSAEETRMDSLYSQPHRSRGPSSAEEKEKVSQSVDSAIKPACRRSQSSGLAPPGDDRLQNRPTPKRSPSLRLQLRGNHAESQAPPSQDLPGYLVPLDMKMTAKKQDGALIPSSYVDINIGNEKQELTYSNTTTARSGTKNAASSQKNGGRWSNGKRQAPTVYDDVLPSK